LLKLDQFYEALKKGRNSAEATPPKRRGSRIYPRGGWEAPPPVEFDKVPELVRIKKREEIETSPLFNHHITS